jgi:hypothetical protein
VASSGSREYQGDGVVLKEVEAGLKVAGHTRSTTRYSRVGENGGWCRLPRPSQWLCVGLRLAQLGGDPHALQAQQPWCSEHGEQRYTRRDEDKTRLPVRWCWPVARLHYRW